MMTFSHVLMDYFPSVRRCKRFYITEENSTTDYMHDERAHIHVLPIDKAIARGDTDA